MEICNDRANLISLGLDVRSFAYPFGDWNASVRQAVVDCGYDSARSISGLDGAVAAETFAPRDPFVLRAPGSIQSTHTLADIESWVSRAEAQGGWLLLTFHHVCDGCYERHPPRRFRRAARLARAALRARDRDGPRPRRGRRRHEAADHLAVASIRASAFLALRRKPSSVA